MIASVGARAKILKQRDEARREGRLAMLDEVIAYLQEEYQRHKEYQPDRARPVYDLLIHFQVKRREEEVA